MKYKNILHIDDDLDDCELFHDALSSFSNARYTAFTDPVAALHLLQAQQVSPDVIIVDLNMPTVNGMEFLSEVKRMVHLEHVPVIIFSTCGRPDSAQKALTLGADEYWIKPANFNSLISVLRHKL